VPKGPSLLFLIASVLPFCFLIGLRHMESRLAKELIESAKELFRRDELAPIEEPSLLANDDLVEPSLSRRRDFSRIMFLRESCLWWVRTSMVQRLVDCLRRCCTVRAFDAFFEGFCDALACGTTVLLQGTPEKLHGEAINAQPSALSPTCPSDQFGQLCPA